MKKLASVMLFLLACAVPLSAAPASHTPPPKPASTAPQPLPTTWKKVQDNVKKLHAVIDGNKLGEVHKYAFAIRDQVDLLPASSTGLSTANQAKLKKGVQTVDTLAEQLDKAGDSNNAAQVETLHKRLDTVLDAIQGLYPRGALGK